MWRYKFLLFIIFVPLSLYTLWQSLRASEIRYFLQRLALFYGSKNNKPGLWIHAASVGEVNAIIPLILKISKENPTLPITLTTNTPTGAAVALKQLPENVQHYYFSLDYCWAIKRLINIIKPKAIFIVETEFWPNLYLQASKNNIPLVIVNGRISEKTLFAKKWLKNIYAEILPLVTHVYARSKTDQSRFLSLGTDPTKIEILGNIKFATSAEHSLTAINLGRKYVLAASTRENEEQIIIEAWQKADHGEHLLVIVPRHPQRLSEILKQLKTANCNIAIRSKNETITATTDIYIADTIGELKQFILGSEFVVMGGSFVKKGGHNILEVAQMAKAVVFGPDMSNFEDEASLFIQYEAGKQCTLAELVSVFNHFLSDTVYRKMIEQNAMKLIGENNNVEKYHHALIRYIS